MTRRSGSPASAGRRPKGPAQPAVRPAVAPGPPRFRRAVLVSLTGVGIAIVAGFLLARAPSATISRQADQNILIITIDTLRGDALGCYGGAARTPNLDSLAAQGVRFDFAHAHAVVTLPSHTSILTGMYPYQHGVRNNSGFRLKAGTETLATRLKRRGFATAAFIGGFPLDSRFGLDPGFDVYDDTLKGAGGFVEFALPERRADEVVAAARNWLASQNGRWFLWVHIYDPHAPYKPPAPFDTTFARQLYQGEVSYTDAALGPLLDQVRKSARPTLAIVTADHGEGLGEHGEVTHGVFTYESTLRVPLIVAQLAPGAAKPRGVVTSAPVRHVDLLPTVLDALNDPPPGDLPGRSLVPLIDEDGTDAERTSYFEAMTASLGRGWAPLQGVLAGREKYIDVPLPELYDLATDPGETTNLNDRRDDRRRALVARLRAFNAPVAQPGQAEDAEVVARLRALGYVSGTAVAPRTHYTEDDDPKRLIELDRRLHHGIELYENGKIDEAIAVYKQVLVDRPTMPAAFMHLAFLYWEEGHVAEAIATLRGALRSGVTNPELSAQFGIYLAESGAARDAIPLLEALPDQNGWDFDVQNALGIAYARAGQPDKAIATFDRLLHQDTLNVVALLNVGSVYLQQGRLGAAREALTRSLAIDERSARAHTALGAAELKLGNRAAAFQHWRRAVEVEPKEFDALYNLGTELARDGAWAEARPYLERFIREAPPALYGQDIELIRKMIQGRGQ